jgi:micrococcal nuclease
MTRSKATLRFRRRWLSAGAMLLLAGLVYADQRGWLLVRQSDDFATYHGRTARVTQIIDGDTFDIEFPDVLHDRSVTRVRLIGIDCPEPAHAGNPAEPLANAATALTRSQCENKTVRLWLEPAQPRDVFGRVLAHVELPDRTRLNETLLANGLAKADDRWPHTLLVRYAQVEITARRGKVGLWGQDERGRRSP